MLADDDLIEYYKRELSYLRNQGADFSARYPKVASRLAFGGAESPDPHTERLIEANAFLAARVHRDLDREFPQVAAALLESQCPSRCSQCRRFRSHNWRWTPPKARSPQAIWCRDTQAW
jgi:type VI secretion system protein ImpG